MERPWGPEIDIAELEAENAWLRDRINFAHERELVLLRNEARRRIWEKLDPEIDKVVATIEKAKRRSVNKAKKQK